MFFHFFLFIFFDEIFLILFLLSSLGLDLLKVLSYFNMFDNKLSKVDSLLFVLFIILNKLVLSVLLVEYNLKDEFFI